MFIQRNNGIWYGVFSSKRKRKWISTGTSERRETLVIYKEMEDEYRKISQGGITNFCDDFIERGALNYSPKTLDIYQRAFKNFSRLIGDKKIARVTVGDSERFRSRRALEVSPVSVNIELRTLHSAFNDAKRLKLIEDNPFEGVKLLKVPQKEGSCLNEEELRRLVGSIQDKCFRDIILFAVFTLMRRGEIVNLLWSDIDIERGLIHIKSSEDFCVKGGKPRSMPMSQWVLEFLRTKPRVGKHVFCDSRGRQLKGQSLSQRFRRLVRSQGVHPGVHFHSLRHTGISMLANRGVPLQYVQKLAGHYSVKVAQIYTHLDDKNLKGAVNSFPIVA